MRRAAVSAQKSRVTGISIFAVGATLLAPYAIAQEQDAAAANPQGEQQTTKSEDDLTEILVTGIRKALQTSQEIKKEADTVVDSITASDIGAFPDKSVAEALQRMSGVTVTRFAASGDTSHFSAEPSGVWCAVCRRCAANSTAATASTRTARAACRSATSRPN